MATDTQTLRPLLYIIGLIGILGIWGRTALDGTLVNLFVALHGSNDYNLPGTDNLLRRSFTGIYWPIDYSLDVLVVFFWEAVDGSHPATSTIGVYFLGQLFPILVAFYMNCFRQGRQGRLLESTFWLLAFQALSLGATNFLWALSSITSSPMLSSSLSLNALRNASLLPAQRTLHILPALLLGYWLPAILMSLPSPGIVSNDFQQWAIVTWNLYPLLVHALFRVFAAAAPVVVSGKRTDAPPTVGAREEHLKAVRLVSGTAILVSFIVHIAVLTLAISSSLFPALLNPSHAPLLSLSSLFLPPFYIAKGRTVGDGVRGFMLWDQLAGYAVMLLVAVLELRTVVKARKWETNWMKSLGFVVFGCLLIGPGSTCLAIRWAGDEDLFKEGKDDKGVEMGKVK